MTDRARYLIARHMEATLTPDERDEFNAVLAADPAARSALVEATIHARLIATRLSESASLAEPASTPAAPRFTGAWKFTAAAVSIAAVLLVAAAIVALFVPAIVERTETDNTDTLVPVATIIDAYGDVFFNDDVANPGDELRPGSYSVGSGAAELQLASGANLRLLPDSRIEIYSPMRAALMRGSASIYCPPSAVGYTVLLPSGARVVDLGTAFRLRTTHDGRVSVIVTEGHVRIDDASGANPADIPAGQMAFLSNGRLEPGARLSAYGVEAYAEQVLADRPVSYRPLALKPNADGSTPLDGWAANIANVDGSPTAEPLREFTVEAWVLLAPEANGWHRVLSQPATASSSAWLLGVSPPKPDVSDSASWVVTIPGVYDHRSTSSAAAAGRWVHVALSADRSGQSQLFIDGVPVATDEPLPTDLALSPSVLVGAHKPGHEKWQGAIAHFAVYDRALSLEAIQSRVRLIERADEIDLPAVHESSRALPAAESVLAPVETRETPIQGSQP